MGFTLGTVFNDDTDWEFTVSNETVESVVAGDGVTEADITNYCFTALIDARCKALVTESVRSTNDGLYPWALDYCAGYMSNSGANPCKVTMNVDKLTSEAVTCYERNLLTYYGNINGVTGHYLVMDMVNIKRWCINFDTTPIYGSGSVSSTSGFPGYSGGVYAYSESNKARIVPYDPNSEAEDPITGNLRLVNVLTMNDSLWIGYLNPSANSKDLLANQYMVQQAWDTAYAAANTFNAGYPQYILQGLPTSFQGWSNFSDIEFPESTGQTQGFTSYLECDDTVHSVIRVSGQYGNNQSSFQTVNIEQGNLVKTLKDVHMIEAWCGLLFIDNGVLYKPLIENKLIIGFTSDMDRPSEWDDITNVTGNNISPTPPSPGPTPGYDDDPWHGATFSGTGVGGAGAFAKCYYMTSTELANLRSWMNSINVPEGFDPMQQIIGLSQVPVALSGDGAENVVFVNSSAVYDPGVTTRAVDTGVSTQQAMGTPISYYLGSVDIVRRMQERGEPYLDYDCQIELYLPLIGMFSLDTQAVMGRTISAYAVLDPVSGTLAAYAYVTKDGQNLPIAYGSTTIGVDLPISAQQLSVSRAALKQANAQLGASLLSGALTMLAAASTGGKSSGSGAKTSTGSSGLSAAGIREAGSDYMKASQVGNVFGDFMNWGRTIRQLSYGNNTAVAGSFGGSTAQWSYPFTPYVKIIRPRYEKPRNYNHSQGVPCVQKKRIGDCTGLIQCIGADVSGITRATDLERQAIQAALNNGVYAGGGS